MAKTETQMPLADVRKKYDSIDCFFTYYDGDKSTFDFYGTDVSLIQVNTNDTLRFVITKTNAGQVASLQYQIVLEPPAIPYV